MEIRNKFTKLERKGIKCDPSKRKIKASFKDESDVNKIMAKYLKTGQLPNLIQKDARYGDFASVPSYMEAMEIVHKSQAAFDSLPAQIRKECGNDPALFLELVKVPEWRARHKAALSPLGGVSDAAKGIQEAANAAAATQPGASSSSSHPAKESTNK